MNTTDTLPPFRRRHGSRGEPRPFEGAVVPWNKLLSQLIHLLLGVVVVAGVVVLTIPAGTMPHPDPMGASDEDDQPGSGFVGRAGCTEIWIPEEWAFVAAAGNEHGAPESHQALRKYLEDVGREDFWYVIVLEGHQAHGEPQTQMVLRQPYAQPQHFEEFLEIVAAASGRPGPRRGLDFTTVRILGIPDELRGLSPREVYAKLASGWRRSTSDWNAEPADVPPASGLVDLSRRNVRAPAPPGP